MTGTSCGRAGARGDRDGMRARRIDGPAPPRVEDGLGDARLGGVAGAGAQRAVGLEQVDGRDVGHLGDREPDDLGEALLGVERRGEQLARAGDDVRLDARGALAGERGLRRALGALVALPRRRRRRPRRSRRPGRRRTWTMCWAANSPSSIGPSAIARTSDSAATAVVRARAAAHGGDERAERRAAG